MPGLRGLRGQAQLWVVKLRAAWSLGDAGAMTATPREARLFRQRRDGPQCWADVVDSEGDNDIVPEETGRTAAADMERELGQLRAHVERLTQRVADLEAAAPSAERGAAVVPAARNVAVQVVSSDDDDSDEKSAASNEIPPGADLTGAMDEAPPHQPEGEVTDSRSEDSSETGIMDDADQQEAEVEVEIALEQEENAQFSDVPMYDLESSTAMNDFEDWHATPQSEYEYEHNDPGAASSGAWHNAYVDQDRDQGSESDAGSPDETEESSHEVMQDEVLPDGVGERTPIHASSADEASAHDVVSVGGYDIPDELTGHVHAQEAPEQSDNVSVDASSSESARSDEQAEARSAALQEAAAQAAARVDARDQDEDFVVVQSRSRSRAAMKATRAGGRVLTDGGRIHQAPPHLGREDQHLARPHRQAHRATPRSTGVRGPGVGGEPLELSERCE